jgi:hypothetical protein
MSLLKCIAGSKPGKRRGNHYMIFFLHVIGENYVLIHVFRIILFLCFFFEYPNGTCELNMTLYDACIMSMAFSPCVLCFHLNF